MNMDKLLRFRQHIENGKTEFEKMVQVSATLRKNCQDDDTAIAKLFLESMKILTHEDVSLFLSIALVRLAETKNGNSH